ncbi:MAG: hypothetical protein GC187_04655 [Alphaproteobacteria bacterium]|nr:hypothetical protein [Alphaproteobacteria bacterium]
MPLAGVIIPGLAPGAPAIRADSAAAPAPGGAAEAFEALLGEAMGSGAQPAKDAGAAQAIAASFKQGSSGMRAAAPAGDMPVVIDPESGAARELETGQRLEASPTLPVTSASNRPAQSDIAAGEVAQVDPARALPMREPREPLQRPAIGGAAEDADGRADGEAQAPVLTARKDMTLDAPRPAGAEGPVAAGDAAGVRSLLSARVDPEAASPAPSDAAPKTDSLQDGESEPGSAAEARAETVPTSGIAGAPGAASDAAPKTDSLQDGESEPGGAAEARAETVRTSGTAGAPGAATDAVTVAPAITSADAGLQADAADAAALDASPDADGQSVSAPVADPKSATEAPPPALALPAEVKSNAAPVRREAEGRRSAGPGQAGDEAGAPAKAGAKAQDPAPAQPASALPKAGAPEPALPRSPDAFQALLQAQTRPSAEPGPLRSVEGAPDPAGDAGLRSAPDRAAEAPRPASLTQPGAAPRFAPHTVQTLAAQIMRRQAEGVRVFDIRMDPPELGRVGVRLELGQDQRVKAMLTAERPDTLQELQRTARDLERALAEAGLDLAQNGLSFSLGGERGDHDGRGFGEPRGVRSAVEIDAPRPGAPVTALYGFALARAAGLDIRA